MKFIILAAGKGSRVGRTGQNLHKALLPLGGKAILSHQLSFIPQNADIAIITGHNADQIHDYVKLAHPKQYEHITFIRVENWNTPEGGPGTSLLAARDFVGHDDMAYVACDTLWSPTDIDDWDAPSSWIGVAQMPAGSSLDQWCRVDINQGKVLRLHDKNTEGRSTRAYVGLAFITSDDILDFWHSLLATKNAADHAQGEIRDVDGFNHIISRNGLQTRHITWTDTGTEASYRAAVARVSGYDWTKIDQATYVLPKNERVVKYFADNSTIPQRTARSNALMHITPRCIDSTSNMLAYEYMPGVTVYDYLSVVELDDGKKHIESLLKWYTSSFTKRVTNVSQEHATRVASAFYREKSYQRANMLDGFLHKQALDALDRIPWDRIIDHVTPVHGHGDFNFGNIICTRDNKFIGIDWREDFAGELWIDSQYDLGKLMAGTFVHWGNARRGDFRVWRDNYEYACVINSYIQNHTNHDVRTIEIIGALSLINCAPLHASPLDEILVARAAYWLDQLL